jgi:hypothetical protein
MFPFFDGVFKESGILDDEKLENYLNQVMEELG